jgi:outer membrane receptor protein involved in Fe transport
MLQRDDRVVYGLKASKTWFTTLFGASATNVLGVQSRVDDIRDVGIFSTYRRQVIGTTQNAGVLESNAALYAESSVEWLPSLRTTFGVREDVFDFDVKDKMLTGNGTCSIASDPLGCVTGNERASILSPKAGVVLGPWHDTTYFITAGDGYHSNDARGVTRSGEAPGIAPVTPLTRAVGAEIGVASTLIGAWTTTFDVFKLKLKSELVFDGDAGVTTPSGSTTRLGAEWSNVVHFNNWLSADLNAAFTRARFDSDSAPDDLGCASAAPTHPCATPVAIVGRYVPNSPTTVVEAGLTAQRENGLFGSLRSRHFGASPLVEDNSAKSPGYTTVDAQIGFRQTNRWLVALDLFNLADVKWNDIEYYYVSRLRNETSPQPGYEVHAGVPRTLRARLQYSF